jgi:hypothetical protein
VNNLQFHFLLSPDIWNTNSVFYGCQTGVGPIISGANLAAGTRRHEGGAQNSHFKIWKDFWGTTDQNNYGVAAERLVRYNISDQDWSSDLGAMFGSVLVNFIGAQSEPCEVNMSDDCQTNRGVPNYCLG